MSENNNQTSLRRDDDVSDFPVAAIICLSVGGYVMLVMIFLIVRRVLVSKGMFQSNCCCPESIPACCVCGNIDEVCQSSCGNYCGEGCLAAMCGIDKEIKCKDIFCCCCMSTCQQGCCDSCTDLCPTSLHCCCHPVKCCACDLHCPSCFADLDPNACGCLCLEIKLRTAHRSSSAPPRGSQSQNINAHVSSNGVSNHGNMYHTGKLNGSTADGTLGKGKIGDGGVQEGQQPSSHSPTKAASHYHQILPNKLNDSNTTDTPASQKSVHVNFCAALDESLARLEPQHVSSSAVLSSSAPGDLLTRSLKNRAGSSERDTSRRARSRSRRLICPGQISQRFPNKILVTSESLNFCSMDNTTSVISEASLIPTNEKSLSNISVQSDAVNLRRPLPPVKRTI